VLLSCGNPATAIIRYHRGWDRRRGVAAEEVRSRHHVGMTAASEAPRFRFSLQAVKARSKRDWVKLVRRIDDAGFDMVVTADHLGGCLSPLMPLATAAEVSDRLRLGVMSSTMTSTTRRCWPGRRRRWTC
jgi:hypothetical protein